MIIFSSGLNAKNISNNLFPINCVLVCTFIITTHPSAPKKIYLFWKFKLNLTVMPILQKTVCFNCQRKIKKLFKIFRNRRRTKTMEVKKVRKAMGTINKAARTCLLISRNKKVVGTPQILFKTRANKFGGFMTMPIASNTRIIFIVVICGT